MPILDFSNGTLHCTPSFLLVLTSTYEKPHFHTDSEFLPFCILIGNHVLKLTLKFQGLALSHSRDIPKLPPAVPDCEIVL